MERDLILGNSRKLPDQAWPGALGIINLWVIWVNVVHLVAKLCPTLCDLMDCSPSGSSVCMILQTRILKWVAISFPRISSQPRNQTHISCIAGRFFTTELRGEPISNALSNNKTTFCLYRIPSLELSYERRIVYNFCDWLLSSCLMLSRVIHVECIYHFNFMTE